MSDYINTIIKLENDLKASREEVKELIITNTSVAKYNGDVQIENIELTSKVGELVEALHDAINRPKGVVPVSAEKFYDPNKALTPKEEGSKE